MKAFDEFKREDKSFWFFVRFISERLGYSKKGAILSYSYEQIEQLCEQEDIDVSPDRINKAVAYSDMRADLINNVIEKNLMDVDEAREIFEEMYNSSQYKSKLIMNKQSGEKKKINYFTAIITMIAEKVLGGDEDFNPDPRGLVYLLNNKKIIGASSRRFDGAYPSVYSPKIVWEIKEYYYTKSFGSRVADAVYEAELDGYEFREIYDRTGVRVHHVMFIDSHYCFWVLGRSYLCKFIDTLNMGLIDDLIIGREVLTEWEKVLQEFKDVSLQSEPFTYNLSDYQKQQMIAEPKIKYGFMAREKTETMVKKGLGRNIVECAHCHKKYYQYTINQIEGIRESEDDICPYCQEVNDSSWNVEFRNSKMY